MSLAASMTGIDLTMMPAAKAEDVHAKVIPPSWSQERLAASLGCWRSHANIWRKIITEDISTALILEDDADWDVNIKEQMFLQSQAILANPNLITKDSSVVEGKPYSMWLGLHDLQLVLMAMHRRRLGHILPRCLPALPTQEHDCGRSRTIHHTQGPIHGRTWKVERELLGRS
jgi:hypothetical protein